MSGTVGVPGTFSRCSPHGRLDASASFERPRGWEEPGNAKSCRQEPRFLPAVGNDRCECGGSRTSTRPRVPPGNHGQRSLQISGGARSIPHPGVLELPCSGRPNPFDLAVKGFTACRRCPELLATLHGLRSELAPNDFVTSLDSYPRPEADGQRFARACEDRTGLRFHRA